MADNELEILIKTIADMTGVDVTKEQMAELKTSVDAASGEGGAEGGIKGMNFRGSEMRHLFGELNRVTPGLGMALRSLAHGAGELAVVMLAIQAATVWWKYFHEQEAALLAQHTHQLEEFAKSSKAALDAHWEFINAIATAAQGEDIYDKIGKSAEKMSDVQESNKEKLAQMDEQKDLERIENEEKAGVIGTEAAEKMKEQIRLKYAAQREQEESQAEQRKIDIQKGVLAQEDERLKRLTQTHDDKAAAATGARKAGDFGTADQLQKDADALAKRIDALQSKKDSLEDSIYDAGAEHTGKDAGRLAGQIGQGGDFARKAAESIIANGRSSQQQLEALQNLQDTLAGKAPRNPNIEFEQTPSSPQDKRLAQQSAADQAEADRATKQRTTEEAAAVKKAEEDKAADDVRRQLFAVGVNPDKTSMEKILDAAMEPANVLADIANGTKKISDLGAGLKAAYKGQADVMVDLLMSHTAEIKDLKKRLEATHTHT